MMSPSQVVCQTASAGTQPRLVYWDIDGTLISTSGGLAGGLFADAVSHVLGRDVQPVVGDGVGRTDLDIVAETFRGAGVLANAEELTLALKQLDDISGELDYSADRMLLPGVDAALESASRLGWVNALLTGNTRRRGFLKVAAFGLEDRFDWDRSAFGGSTPVRAEVVANAIAHSFPDGFTIAPVVVGDTPADIAAAHQNDLRCVAVSTGDFGPEALADADLLVVDLASGLAEVTHFLEERAKPRC